MKVPKLIIDVFVEVKWRMHSRSRLMKTFKAELTSSINGLAATMYRGASDRWRMLLQVLLQLTWIYTVVTHLQEHWERSGPEMNWSQWWWWWGASYNDRKEWNAHGERLSVEPSRLPATYEPHDCEAGEYSLRYAFGNKRYQRYSHSDWVGWVQKPRL